jgi:hypothetical protein
MKLNYYILRFYFMKDISFMKDIYVKISAFDDKGVGLVEKQIYSVTWLDNKKY